MNKKLILILLATVLVVSSLFFLVSCGDEVSIDHLEIYSMPKTEYNLGESLDIKDAKIKVVYKDNTEKLVDITSSMLSGFDPNTLGVQYIKVYYENQSTVFTVTVKRSAVTSVELVIPDENVNYIEGQLLRTSGTYMQVNFLDGSTERINVTKEMCSGFDANRLGSQIINVVGYIDGVQYSSSFVVTVSERELIGIEVTTVPTKQIYYVGDNALDLSGGVLFLKYNSGYSEYIDMADVNGQPIDGLEVEWNNRNVDNRSIVTVKYGLQTAAFQIQVKVRDVSSYVVNESTVNTQMQNLDLDLSGTIITINYNNGESEEVTLPNDRVAIVGYDKSLTGVQQVSIVFSYGGVELATRGTMTIEVQPREAVTLEMVTTPTIYQDTEFDVTQFELCVVYNNGERGEKFNLGNNMIVWTNDIIINSYAEEGSQSWHIVYRTGVELTYNFEVVGLEVIGIELQNASNVIAYMGGSAITDDVRMTITYNSGLVVENVPLLPEMVFDFDNQKAGSHKAKINYVDEYEDGFVTDLYVTVVREITDVIVKGEYRDKYIVGQSFDPTGMELEVSYEGFGTTETIIVPTDGSDPFYNEWTFSADNGLTFTEIGAQTIYIENAGLRENKTFVVYVQNNIVSIGPLYSEVEGVLKQVSGFEGEEAYKNVGFGSVLEGLDIDLTNYYIFIDYESETHDEYVPVTKEMIDYNPKYTAIGDRAVTIYYPDYANYTGDEYTKHATKVSVLEKSVVGVKLLSAPDRTIYYQDEDNINGVGTEYEGMMISLEYDNGTYGAINIDEAISQGRLIIGNVDVREIGTKVISLSYYTLDDEPYEVSFEVQVVNSTPVSISWVNETIPYVELSLGTEFNILRVGYIDDKNMIKPLAELGLNIMYSGSSFGVHASVSELVEDGLLRVESYNANQTGIQDVKLVHVNDPTLYVTVTTKVVERTLKEINLVKNGTVLGDDEKIEVIQSAVLDLTYLSLQLVFSDDAKTIIPMDSSYVNVSAENPNGYDINNATIGDRNVTISYLYANESAPVTKVVVFTIKEKSLWKIEINDIPKQFYIEHEPLDLSYGSIMLYYDNGTTAVENLSKASTSNSSDTFYIDKSRFDNSEFTGYSKVQPIKIRYGGCTTSYNIYMRDRRNVVTTFDNNNVYTYTYGDIGFVIDGELIRPNIAVTMKGYKAFGDNEADADIKNFTIEYIPKDIWESQKREDGVDYTIVPKEVGEYVIVVSYNTNMEDIQDGIHNAYEDSSNTLTILKKTIYVSFEGQNKTYGDGNPVLYLTLSSDGENVSDNPTGLFAPGDGFRTPSFNPEYDKYYSTIAMLMTGEDSYEFVDIFNIVYMTKEGVVIDVIDTTSAGTYNIVIENQFESPNYNLIYQNAELVINKRQVIVTPESISYAYGTEIIPTIPYTTIGLYGSDVLAGSPSKTGEGTGVGEYKIGSGSLKNDNYVIVMDEKSSARVYIVARNIYVKTDSTIKVYGEKFVSPQVRFFSDPACTTEEGAFAPGDSLATIGELEYPNTIDEKTAVGNHKYTCTISGNGAGKDNYNIVYVSGYVEVIKRPVNVIAKATSKVYGEEDPTIEFDILPIDGESASGIVNNDMFEGSLSRVEGDNYGEYSIQIGTLKNENYDIRFTSSTFSILRKELYVYIPEENLTKVYDGRLPQIENYAIYEDRSEGASEYANLDVRQFIEFSFKGASKGFGLYEVSVQVNSNNYSIALYSESGYSYEIEKRKVAITKNEFYDLPDGLEYKGSAYEFYAQINPADLQHIYNSDGSYATDDENKPLFDDPSVTLSIQSVINQGTYTVSVVEIADKNYELDEENSMPITFTLLPRTVKIVINTNAENNTIEREFNNESAYISAGDYTLDNLISEDDIPYFNLGIYSGDKITSATDVYYDENGNIIGYDIRIVENSYDPNYVVELAQDYKYKIVPKGVVIRIYDKYLTKSYDGVVPSIKTSMFSPVKSEPGFDTNDVIFEFIREENDGRDNSCVGSYSIQVTCTDRNFNVTTQQPNYVYNITKANVSVSVNAQGMEKSYDGLDYAFDNDDLTFTAYYGNTLIVHNFRHAVGTDDPYQQFVTRLQEIENAVNGLDGQLRLVDFSELSYAKNNLTTSITKSNELMNVLRSVNNPMQKDNTTSMISSLETIITYLNNAINAINNEETEEAEGYYRMINTILMPAIKNVFDKEQSYVAFIFGTETENSAISVGTHPFTVEFSDYNRNFTLLNSNKIVTVSTRILYINVANVNRVYGVKKTDLEDKIEFELYDPRTGEIIVDQNFQVYGTPAVIGTVRNVGEYDIDVSSIYVSEGGGVKSDNYVLLPGDVGKVVINKAPLTIKIRDKEDESLFVYGKTIESSQFIGEYDNLSPAELSENSTEEWKIALMEEATAWADANGYGSLSHVEKMTVYFGQIKFDDETFENIIKSTAVKYNCYLNGESGTQIFDVDIFDAGDYKVSATGFKADNYEIRVVPGKLTVAKRQLTLYSQQGYYEKEYGEDGISYVYTNFARNEDANSVMVYIDNDGDNVAETEVSSLANIVWNYTASGEVNPLDPSTPVTGDILSFMPNKGSYELKNYDVDFGLGVNVMVTKAPLYCTLAPTDDSLRVSSLYMALPSDDSYKFTYNGLKNNDRAEDLITTQPTIDFMNGGSYFNAGVHTLGQSNLNTTGISLQNYDLKVEEFQYEVKKRKVYVTLDGVEPSISYDYQSFNITPYMAEITYMENSGVTSANIISGQYGYTNFVFTIEGSDVTDEIRNAFNNISITRRTRADSVFNETTITGGSTYVEVYRYSDMYKHTISGSVDHEKNIATLTLGSMSMNSINFEFAYLPFKVEVYSSISGVLASMQQKLVASDLALTDDEINDLISFTVFKSSGTWTSMTVKEMLSNGTLSIDGSIPDATSINALMNYTLEDPAYNYSLKNTLTDVYYTQYYSGTSNSSNVVDVSDSRVATYDYSSVATCSMPLRFYPETTALVKNPQLSDGIEYKKAYSTTSIATITADETLFNAMQLEFSIRPNASVKVPRLEIGFNADINGAVISMAFNYGASNIITVTVNNGSSSASVNYSVNYGNLFDGNMHEIRAYLNKENLTLIVSIDGASGEMLSLAGIKLGDEVVLSSVEDIVESSTLTLALGGEYVIRKLLLSEQGLYDGVGAHISLPVKSANVIKVSTTQDTFETTVANLNSMFGINRLDDSYSVALYVNGESVEYRSTATSIKLPSGIHLVEMALYKDGALIDYDYVYMRIERESYVMYVDRETGHNTQAFVPGAQLTLYTTSSEYVASDNQDGNLVSNGVVQEYGYLFSSDRAHNETNPYSYFNMRFALEASATYDSSTSTASYLAGSYVTTIELFATGGFGTVTNARENGDESYQGACLTITREQTSTVAFGVENSAYTYTVVFSYYVNGKSRDEVIAMGTTDSAFEVVVYKDRNTAYYGNNGVIVSIRSLYSNTSKVYEFNSGELNANNAMIYPQVYGLGDRMTIYNATFEEESANYRDYLVSGQYVSSDDAVLLEKDEDLTLINNIGSALYSIYDNLVFNFSISETYVAGADDKITINVAESKLDGSGNGVTLVYDLSSNALIFNFYLNGTKSLEQVWQLSGTISGEHKLQVILDKKLLEGKANTYVGGDSGNENLSYGGVSITDTLGSVIHYTSVKVIMDGAETTFYMPLYNDMSRWIRADGNAYGSNPYSDVTGLTSTPTFLPLYSYTSISANVDNAVTVQGYMVAKGANNTYASGAVTESPII